MSIFAHRNNILKPCFIYRHLFKRVALIGLCCCLHSVHANPLPLTEGQPAPNLTGTLINGLPFNLAQEKGHVVIVNLWAPWCLPCRTEMPFLEHYRLNHEAQGVKVLAISMDEERENDPKVVEILSKYHFLGAYARQMHLDGYGDIWRMPMTFIIDQQGILRKDGSKGQPQVDNELLEQVVTPLLAVPVAHP